MIEFFSKIKFEILSKEHKINLNHKAFPVWTLIMAMFIGILFSCNSSKKISTEKHTNFQKSDTVRIANDALEYEVIIIDGGFTSWLNSMAKPRGFYTENFLESRNRIYVTEWNRRVLQPSLYKPSLYEMQINYDININYGYEVNYLIYNYFIYFQLNYKEQLAGFVPNP